MALVVDAVLEELAQQVGQEEDQDRAAEGQDALVLIAYLQIVDHQLQGLRHQQVVDSLHLPQTLSEVVGNFQCAQREDEQVGGLSESCGQKIKKAQRIQHGQNYVQNKQNIDCHL